jgi:DNA-binding SARP family transcriptional activator
MEHESISITTFNPGPPYAPQIIALGEAASSPEELHLSTLEDRIDADLALGRHDQLVSELEKLVAAYPVRERLRGQLMLALYRARRKKEALQAYRIGRRLLLDEMGIEPSPELNQLNQQIRADDPSLGHSDPEH